jgi:hypothetical protein
MRRSILTQCCILSVAALTLTGWQTSQAATAACTTVTGFGGSSPLFPGGQVINIRPCYQSSTDVNGGFAEAESDGDRGIFKTNATASFSAGTISTASAQTRWNEQFVVINHPDSSMQGSSGLLRFDMYLEGYLDATGSAFSNVIVQAFDTFTSTHTIFSTSATSITGPKAVSQFIEGAFIFKFGEQFQFGINVSNTVGRRSGLAGAGWGEAAFGSTGYWGGIRSIEDAFGNSVTNYSFMGSNSGFDFTLSTRPSVVPLPGAFWLMVSSLVLIGSTLRKSIKFA